MYQRYSHTGHTITELRNFSSQTNYIMGMYGELPSKLALLRQWENNLVQSLYYQKIIAQCTLWPGAAAWGKKNITQSFLNAIIKSHDCAKCLRIRKNFRLMNAKQKNWHRFHVFVIIWHSIPCECDFFMTFLTHVSAQNVQSTHFYCAKELALSQSDIPRDQRKFWVHKEGHILNKFQQNMLAG